MTVGQAVSRKDRLSGNLARIVPLGSWRNRPSRLEDDDWTMPSRTTGMSILAIVEILLCVFALVGGVVHLTLRIGGLVDFSGKDLTISSDAAKCSSERVHR